MTRADGRAFDQLRPVELTKDYIKFAEGSVLIRCGDTVVLCNASVEEKNAAPCAGGTRLGDGGIRHAAPG